MTKQKRTSYGGSGTDALSVHGRARWNAKKKGAEKIGLERAQVKEACFPYYFFLSHCYAVPVRYEVPCVVVLGMYQCMYSRTQLALQNPTHNLAQKGTLKLGVERLRSKFLCFFKCLCAGRAFAACGLMRWQPLDVVLTSSRAWRQAPKTGLALVLITSIITFVKPAMPEYPPQLACCCPVKSEKQLL